MPSAGVAVAVEIVGARLACTTTDSGVADAVPPRPSFTVTTTLNVAAVRNVCTGFCSVDTGVPSPKFHE